MFVLLVMILTNNAEQPPYVVGGYIIPRCNKRKTGLGMPVNSINHALRLMHNLFAKKDLKIIYFASQLVAGSNYKTIFKTTGADGKVPLYIGIKVYVKLPQKPSAPEVSELIITHQKNQIFEIFNVKKEELIKDPTCNANIFKDLNNFSLKKEMQIMADKNADFNNEQRQKARFSDPYPYPYCRMARKKKIKTYHVSDDSWSLEYFKDLSFRGIENVKSFFGNTKNYFWPSTKKVEPALAKKDDKISYPLTKVQKVNFKDIPANNGNVLKDIEKTIENPTNSLSSKPNDTQSKPDDGKGTSFKPLDTVPKKDNEVSSPKTKKDVEIKPETVKIKEEKVMDNLKNSEKPIEAPKKPNTEESSFDIKGKDLSLKKEKEPTPTDKPPTTAGKEDIVAPPKTDDKILSTVKPPTEDKKAHALKIPAPTKDKNAPNARLLSSPSQTYRNLRPKH